MNPETQRKLEAWLHYFDDIGISAYYRDRAPQLHPAAVGTETPAGGAVGEMRSEKSAARAPAAPAARPSPQPPLFVPEAGPSLFDAAERVENDSLERIREDIGDCRRCKLCEQRTNIVFGTGNPKARLMFVGEGPGRDEDEQGIPFVGRAGQLLTQMIEAMGLKREDVYIANVVKCRPPENRAPEKNEIATCSPFLLRQIEVIRPQVIVCLGSIAAQTLLKTREGISRYRGEWFEFRGAKLLATYHPAYLLRNPGPGEKRKVWLDLQKVMAELGLKPKPKS
jgi:DNA polymerase